MIEQLFTVPETARILRVKPVTIRKWIYEGQLPCCRLSRRVTIKQRDIENFIKKSYSGKKE